MPPTNESIMPMVNVPSVDAVRDFYVDKLGFDHQMGVVGKDGALDFVNVVRGSAALMFSRDPEGGEAAKQQTVEFYINVGDVDAVYADVTKRGVEAADPLTDQWWGDRTFVVQDPNGFRVWFASKVAEAVPPPGLKVV